MRIHRHKTIKLSLKIITIIDQILTQPSILCCLLLFAHYPSVYVSSGTVKSVGKQNKKHSSDLMTFLFYSCKVNIAFITIVIIKHI